MGFVLQGLMEYGFPMLIGDAIRELRLARNWTQNELGGKLGHVHGGHVSRWESNQVKPQRRSILAMNSIFGLDIEEYAEQEEEKSVNPPRGEIVSVHRKGDLKRVELNEISPASLEHIIEKVRETIEMNEALLNILIQHRLGRENEHPREGSDVS